MDTAAARLSGALAGFSAAVADVPLNTPEPPAQGALRLIVFDVGQGLAVAAQTRQHALLYDTGPDFSGEADSGNRILIPTLRALGIAGLDGLILSHDDTDHTGGTASVMQAMPVGWISSSCPRPSFSLFINKLKNANAKVIILNLWQFRGKLIL